MSKRVKVNVKVCGITRREDAISSLELGAAAIGINIYPPSPRFVSLESAKELLEIIPPGKRVMVDVAPTPKDLQKRLALGFDFFQIHFPLFTLEVTIAEWSSMVSPERLWLVPRLPEGESFPETILEFANTFLVHAPSGKLFGGAGKTGNWKAFNTLKNKCPQKTWILAGGLNPENIKKAIPKSGTRYIDISSGVESSPGIKDKEKINKLFQNLKSL